MKVEPSGVVMIGICTIQTENCSAKNIAPITAVWATPGRTQINVCRECLEEKIKRGEWEVEGAKTRQSYA
jgi:hypothetical protein